MKEILDKISFNIEKKDVFSNGGQYKVLIKVPMSIGFIEKMKIVIETKDEIMTHKMKHIKNEDGFVYFETLLELPTNALYHYYFSFEANHNFIYFKKNHLENVNSISKADMWKMSVNFEVPDWAKGKIMYHIFVDRFNRSEDALLQEMSNRTIHKLWDEDIIIGKDNNGRWNTDFYGGNLKGIEEKLDYLRSLGVSIIYLSPIFWSQSNHRYDTSDYEKVDPYVGTNMDLKKLCDKAHSMGMKIILDGVFNHTGNDSKYFNEYNSFKEKGAYQGEDSKYYSFYRKYVKDGNTLFDYWWGMKNLPVCDGEAKSWQDYIYGEGGVIDLWFSLGIDGLRLDVADELTDEFIEGIRKAVKRNKNDGFILGEVWKNPMRMNRGYVSSGRGMDSVMNYQLIDALIRYFKYADCDNLKEEIREILVEYPTDTINTLMNFTSTHDITRAINIFGTDEFQYNGEWAWNLNNDDRNWQKDYQMSEEQYNLGKEIYMSYIYTLAFFPGILSIFYGDEIGMQGMGNLANRRPYTWSRKDTELLELFQLIGKIRAKEKFLETADLELIYIDNDYFVFKRFDDENEILVYVNRTNKKLDVVFPKNYEEILYPLKDSNKDSLDAYGGLVLKKVRK